MKKNHAAAITFMLLITLIVSAVSTKKYATDDSEIYARQKKSPEITAHRGNSITAPENTLVAIKYAMHSGADFVELDVQETSDGKIVVMHDTNLKRTTGINKNVSDMTLDELNKIDAGSWFSDKFNQSTIPTLEQVLIMCQLEKKIKLNIEIKPDSHGHITKELVRLLEKYNFTNRCIITSFDRNAISAIKKEYPTIKVGYIYSFLNSYNYLNNNGYMEPADLTTHEVDAVSLYYKLITKETVDQFHKKGIMVYAWTVNTAEDIELMGQLEVDNIITDNPDLAISLFN